MTARAWAAVLVRASVVTAALAIAACTSDDDDPPAASSESAMDPQLGVDPTVPVEEGKLPEPGPTDLTGLAEGDRALALGEEHVAGGNHTTVVDVRRPLPTSGEAPRPGPNHEWVGALVTTCFESELDRQLEIGSYLFSAVSDDLVSFPGVQPMDAQWPLPQYPGYGRLAPGQCTSGWIAIPVPDDVALTSIVQSAVTTDPVAEWAVPIDAW